VGWDNSSFKANGASISVVFDKVFRRKKGVSVPEGKKDGPAIHSLRLAKKKLLNMPPQRKGGGYAWGGIRRSRLRGGPNKVLKAPSVPEHRGNRYCRSMDSATAKCWKKERFAAADREKQKHAKGAREYRT